jgi:glycosyltransferase involved in cell wall biosynthesis
MSKSSTATALQPDKTGTRHSALPYRDWLILTQYYPPEAGAPQVRLHAVANELRALGCNVRVLTALPNYPNGSILPGYRGRAFTREVIDGVDIYRQWLYAASGRRPLARVACYLSFTLGAVLRSMFFPKPEVVFIEAQPLTLALAGLVWKMRGVPYIYNTPDLQVEVAGTGRWVAIDLVLQAAARLERFLMRQALCVTTVTNSFIDHFERERGIYRSSMAYLPNGADAKALRPLTPDKELARQLGVVGKAVFTYAGTHAHYHGLEIVIEAAEELRRRSDIVFLMVGEGPVRDELRSAAAARGLTNVIFSESPFTERARLMSITRAALATIAPLAAARKMRLAKVVPPLACGVPVIYAGEGEWVEVLEREGCGIATPPACGKNLAAAVIRLADEPDLAREMGRRGRKLVEQEYAWSSIVNRWLGEVQSIAAAASERARR